MRAISRSPRNNHGLQLHLVVAMPDITTTFSSKTCFLSMIRNQHILGPSGSCGSSQEPQPPMCIFSWCPNVHSARVYVPRMGPSLSMHSRGNNLLPLGFCLLLLKSSTRFVKIDERAKYTVNFKSRDSAALPETYGVSPGVQANCFDVEFRDSCGRRARSK